MMRERERERDRERMGSSALSVSESVLRTQSLSLCPRNSLKLYNFSSSSCAANQSSKFSYRNSSLLSFRNSINWYNTRFSHSLVTSTTPNGMEFRLPHPHCKSDFDVLEKSLANKNSTRENLNAAPYVSYGALLKFMMLFGYLTIQGSQPAVAALDLSSAMQSISYLGDFGDIKTGFASAFLLIFFSELGDKTFFIAALLAARNSATVVFLGTFGALGAMTIISVFLGRTFHYVDEILPFRFGETDLPVDDIAAVCLLVYFGVSTLIDATSGDGLKADEEQKEAELAVSDFSGNGAGILAAASTIISTFLLVFVAEWGDKSFFSTIALAAASSPLGVIGGALAGHGAATLLAVLGGSLLGTFLSEKVIAYVGGSLFLVFALVTLIEIVT